MNKREQLISWCDQAMAFSFYALIYFLPISIALAETFTGTALLFYLLKRVAMLYGHFKQTSSHGIRQPFWKKGYEFLKAFKPIGNCLNRPIALFLLLNLVSVILSQYRSVSFEGFMGKSLQNAFLYFTFIECINSKKRLRIFLTVFFISAALICFNGLYQYFVGHGFIRGHLVYDGRISSSLRAHNDFAAYLVPLIPILLVFSLHRWAGTAVKPSAVDFLGGLRGRISLSILSLLSIICLGLTYSRGAWVAFIIVILFMAFQRKRNVFISFLIIVLFFSVFYPLLQKNRDVMLFSDSATRQEGLIGKIVSVFDWSREKAAGKTEVSVSRIREVVSSYFRFFGGSGRTQYWHEAVNMIRDYPVFGVGLNTYSLVGRGYKISWGGYPHNCYLQMAVEIGLVGLSSFLWIVFVIFRTGFRNLKKLSDVFLRSLLWGALAGYGGYLIHSFFDTNFYSVQLGSLMWVLMGIVVAAQRIDQAAGAR